VVASPARCGVVGKATGKCDILLARSPSARAIPISQDDDKLLQHQASIQHHAPPDTRTHSPSEVRGQWSRRRAARVARGESCRLSVRAVADDVGTNVFDLGIVVYACSLMVLTLRVLDQCLPLELASTEAAHLPGTTVAEASDCRQAHDAEYWPWCVISLSSS